MATDKLVPDIAKVLLLKKKKKRLYRQSESHGTYKYLEITTLAVDILVPVNGIGIDGIIFTVLGISAKYLKKKKNCQKKKKNTIVNCKVKTNVTNF